MESIRAIVDGHPTVPVVIISAHEERQMILEALGVGVRGYIPKSLDEEAMAHALRAIIAGDIYVPPSTFIITRSPPWPTCRCWRWCPRSTS